MNESNHFVHSRSVLVKLSYFFPPSNLYFHPLSPSPETVSLPIHFQLLFFFLHYRCWGKQLPDLLQHITIQHGKLKLLPTLLSEPQLNLTGPPQLGLNLSRSN